MLALLLCSEAHAKALVKFLKTAHVPQETSVNQFENCLASLTAGNGLGFSDTGLTPKWTKHNDALHVSVECMGTMLSHAMVDTDSSLNVLPKNALDRLDWEGLALNPSIHGAGAVTSTLHQMLKYSIRGKLITVHGEEEYMVSVVPQNFPSHLSNIFSQGSLLVQDCTRVDQLKTPS